MSSRWKKRILLAATGWLLAINMNLWASAEPLLVFHFDFNSVQMNQAAILRTLDHVAAKGYNAILWEIENKVRFACAPELAAPDAFTREEFQAILRHAERLGLEPIPLLQIFGHAEYVLGLGGYRELRENPKRKDCYCPSNPKTTAFQLRLVREYLEIFGPRLKRMHLGSDEVEALGTCPRCQSRQKLDLYLEHLESIAGDLRAKGIRPCIWHDMLQRFDQRGGAFSRLPLDYSLWYWEYFYPRKGEVDGAWANGAEAALDAERKRGREIVLSPSTQCYIDDPFLTRTLEHRNNVAGIAAVVRKERFAGMCVTSWSCHRGPKQLQFPLFDFAAKRLLNPADKAEDDWGEIVRQSYGKVPVSVLDDLTVWCPDFYNFDGRSWSDYKDGAIMPHGRAFDFCPKDKSNAFRLVQKVRGFKEQVNSALTKLRGIPSSELTALTHDVIEAGELKLAYLDMFERGLGGEPTTNAPIERAIRFYMREQSPKSTTNTVEVLYRGFDSARN